MYGCCIGIILLNPGSRRSRVAEQAKAMVSARQSTSRMRRYRMMASALRSTKRDKRDGRAGESEGRGEAFMSVSRQGNGSEAHVANQRLRCTAENRLRQAT